MFLLAAIIGIPILLTLTTAGALVESMNPDELSNMGVVRHV